MAVHNFLYVRDSRYSAELNFDVCGMGISWMSTLIIQRRARNKAKCAGERKSISSFSRNYFLPQRQIRSAVQMENFIMHTAPERASRSVKVNTKFSRFMYFKILFHFAEYWLEQKRFIAYIFFKKCINHLIYSRFQIELYGECVGNDISIPQCNAVIVGHAVKNWNLHLKCLRKNMFLSII